MAAGFLGILLVGGQLGKSPISRMIAVPETRESAWASAIFLVKLSCLLSASTQPPRAGQGRFHCDRGSRLKRCIGGEHCRKQAAAKATLAMVTSVRTLLRAGSLR